MRKLKRSLAVLLAVLVLITALPLTAFADEAAESPPMDTAASIDETVPDEPPISPEDNSGTVEASPPPSPEPSAEPDADENPDGTEDSTASEPDAAPTPDVSATQMPTPIPTPNPINLEYEYLPESETGGLFVFPAPYGDDLTQEYSAEHPAWDIAGDIGSPVVAANDGVVTQVQIWDGSEDETGSMSYGNMVQIKHGEELTTLYAHLSEINVQEGDKGLEDDEYIITEIATDDGYTLLKDSITVVITSAESGVICDVCGKSGITATATVNGDAVGMIEDNGSVSAIVPMSVINTLGFDLPQTGENGTWLFVVGGVLIVSLSAAFIFFILAKKRKTDEQ